MPFLCHFIDAITSSFLFFIASSFTLLILIVISDIAFIAIDYVDILMMLTFVISPWAIIILLSSFHHAHSPSDTPSLSSWLSSSSLMPLIIMPIFFFMPLFPLPFHFRFSGFCFSFRSVFSLITPMPPLMPIGHHSLSLLRHWWIVTPFSFPLDIFSLSRHVYHRHFIIICIFRHMPLHHFDFLFCSMLLMAYAMPSLISICRCLPCIIIWYWLRLPRHYAIDADGAWCHAASPPPLPISSFTITPFSLLFAITPIPSLFADTPPHYYADVDVYADTLCRHYVYWLASFHRHISTASSLHLIYWHIFFLSLIIFHYYFILSFHYHWVITLFFAIFRCWCRFSLLLDCHYHFFWRCFLSLLYYFIFATLILFVIGHWCRYHWYFHFFIARWFVFLSPLWFLSFHVIIISFAACWISF